MSVNSDPIIGRLLDGRYQVRSRIARGGMATVYLATDLRLERQVALKIMHGHLADDSQFRDRFIQEARSAARLAHPNVVNVFDQGQDNDMAYLVMEYLPGITLRELLQDHRILTTEQTFDIVESILSGLSAAHKAGIVHRDLKPENVLLADDGRIKIGDFGLARAANANTATGAALLGTIAYLSPELVTRGIADTRSDIYAVGIMMYEMLVGEQPFKGEQPVQIAYQHANSAVPAPSTGNPKVPKQLDDLVLWATARDPEDRPRDARVLFDRLRETHNALRAGVPTAVLPTQRTMFMPSAAPAAPTAETQVLTAARKREPPSPPPAAAATTALAKKTRSRSKRGRWLLGILILIVAIAAGAGWYFGNGPGVRVTLPNDIAGLSVEAATQRLADLGLSVSPTNGQASHPTMQPGLVVGTDPPLGNQVALDGTVQLQVSTGPRQLPIPDIAGTSETDAVAALTAAPFTLNPVIRQFSDEVEAAFVIDVTGEDGSSIFGLPSYGELRPVTLIVSAGAVPDVSGLSFEEASETLVEIGLNAEIGQEEFSDDIAQGVVIRTDLAASDGTTRTLYPGDSISLVISRGPDLVAVPDVIGDTIANAKAQLEESGFEVVVTSQIPEEQWGNVLAKVATTDPRPGEMVRRNSVITIIGQF